MRKTTKQPSKTTKQPSKTNKTRTDYEHGELLNSITLKAIYVQEKESLLMNEDTKMFQGKNFINLESNKTFDLENVIVEKRTNFCFDYAIIPTKQTKVTKSKKNIKKQYKPIYQRFADVQQGRISNLQCLIINKKDLELQLFDGSFFKMRLKEQMNFAGDKLNILFAKKSTGYNYVWPTNLTIITEVADKDPFWSNLTIPEVKMHNNPENIPLNCIGKWCGMLTTVTPPFTYGNLNF